eukprot:253900_1
MTTKRRMEIQKIWADKNMTSEEKNREMFMIMNSTNINLPNCSSGCSTLLHIKSCAAFNSLTSIPVSDTDKYSSLSTEQYEVAGSEEEYQYLHTYTRLYCPHYPTRRVWIHHPENLLEIYPCRLCYADEIERLHMLDVSMYSNDSACYELPKLDRKQVKYMKCRACLVSQKAMPSCQNPDCYWFQVDHHNYCDVCHLWCNDRSKEVFHCDECGICRVGNREDYAHCNGCNLCIHRQAEHECVESSAEKGKCPVCLETLHDSRKPVVWSECNHMFHDVCLETLLKSTIRCPVCKKSVCNMDTQWNDIDQIMARLSEQQTVPEEYQEMKWQIFCNDCQYVSIIQYDLNEVHKCLRCGSYNTSSEGRYDPESARVEFEDTDEDE